MMIRDFPATGVLLFCLLLTSGLTLEPVSAHSETPQLNDVPGNSWRLVSTGAVTAPENIHSYSGGWYDALHHQLCILGGGHWDYSGNEVWCFDIANLNWREMYPPDVLAEQGGPQGDYNNYDNNDFPGALFSPAGEGIANANPMSRHSYDLTEYVDGLGPVVWGGYSWGDSGTPWCQQCEDTWAFDFTNARWTYLFEPGDSSTHSPTRVAGRGATAYASRNGLMYVLAEGETWTYDPAANRWAQIAASGNPPGNIEGTLEYDSMRNVLYYYGGSYDVNTTLWQFDIAASRWSALPSANGPGRAAILGPGMAYDSRNDVLLLFHSGTIWAYHPDTSEWETRLPEPRPMDTDYVFGRFRYDPVNNGAWFHGFENGQHQTWFYRYAAANAPPRPSVSIVANPLSVAANNASTLTWSSNHAVSCTASGAWSGARALAGSEITAAISADTTFVLRCSGQGGDANRSVTVTVGGSGGRNPGTGSGSGGGTGADTGGGGAVGAFALLLIGMGRRRGTMQRRHESLRRIRSYRSWMSRLIAAATLSLLPLFALADIADITLESLSGTAQEMVPVTFGHVFRATDVPANSIVRATLADGTPVQLQVDAKATHADGSLRHAVLSVLAQSLAGNARETLTLSASPQTGTSGAVALSDLLASSFDTAVSVVIGGVSYGVSVRDLLRNANPSSWLQGPIVSEWLVHSPLTSSAGAVHPHLAARFAVRAYAGIRSVRVSVTLENNWSRVANPANVDYDLNVTVAGRGTVLAQSSLRHYRQARWRRVFWWGEEPRVHVAHDGRYLMNTGAVPTYDPDVRISSATLDQMVSEFEAAGNGLMQIGDLDSYMPSAGGRMEIAPLPRFAARYLIATDRRAARVMLGYGELAGSWPMHYRDRQTSLPISLDDYPNMTIVDNPEWFPPCSDNCEVPYEAEVSHHPTLAYVPYLVTGDYYFLEELQFWANWVAFYGPPERHGFAQGLVVWDQVRGQAWGLRTLGQAAYATPDDHPLKAYFNSKVSNNIAYYNANWLNSNPLAYISNTGPAADWREVQQWISTWMDDFLTWSFGHLVNLGFSDARAMRDWKAVFPAGRMSNPDMCWILASTNWPTVMDNVYLGGSGKLIDTWDDWRRGLILSWDDEAFSNNQSIAGREQDLIDAECNSAAMADILGLPRDVMIGWSGPEGYPANLQPALAVAVDAGIAGAAAGWNTFRQSASYPDYSAEPQWAIVPNTIPSVDGGGGSGDGDSTVITPTGGPGGFDPTSLFALVVISVFAKARRRQLS